MREEEEEILVVGVSTREHDGHGRNCGGRTRQRQCEEKLVAEIVPV